MPWPPPGGPSTSPHRCGRTSSLLGAALLLAIATGYQLDIAELVYSTRGIGGSGPGGHVHRRDRAGARVPDPDRGGGRRGRPAGRQHLVPDPVADRPRGRGLVRALDPGRRHLPDPRAALQRRSQRARRRAAVPDTQHRGDPRRVRPRRDRGPVLHRRAAAHPEPDRRERRHGLQPAAVGLPPAARHLRPAADPAPVLQVQRRRHRPLPDRRQAAPDHAVRPIAGDQPAGGHRPDVDQRAPGLHPRLRNHRGPVNAITPEGQPDYLVSGINRNPELPVGEPRIYFGDQPGAASYIVVGTRTAEFDYPVDDQGGATTRGPATRAWTCRTRCSAWLSRCASATSTC